MARYFIGMSVVLAVALVAGCGGDDDTGVAAMLQGRWGHTATLLEDGRVLIVGGQESPSRKLDTAEIFDPSTGLWSAAGNLTEKHGSGLKAVLLEDGRVLVLGENDDASAEIYDPSTGQWSSAGVMSEARNWPSATLLEDGRVLVAEYGANRITLLSPEGKVSWRHGRPGRGPEELATPWGVAFSDHDRRAMVTDSGNHRVVVLALP